MSMTMVLDTLQSQIHSKTSILPSLYTQLGLPATALNDELISLQIKLTECIDAVVSGRTREVEEWLSRCKGVGQQIEALGRAIGINVPHEPAVTGNTVLPKQFETLTIQCDKLQQTYSSKLEQMNSLRARLVNYTRILGEEFVCYHLQGQDEIPEGQLRDVTPEQFARLEKDMFRSKSEVSRRLSALADTFEHLAWLHEELGLSLPASDPFLIDTGSDADPEILFARLFTAFISSRSALEAVEPTNNLLAWADKLTNQLEDTKTRREAQIQNMYDQLELLWKRLGIDDREIDSFVESWRGSTEAVIEAYESELERMLELKRSTMSTFIANARAEIEDLWTELMYGEEERTRFYPFMDDEHTEDLLTLHEEEIKRLKEERKSKARLLTSIRKYGEICEEEKELAAAATDQSRLLGRGPRDPGRLLREEKMRKRVTKEKPRLQQDLLMSVAQWENENNRPFLVNGVPFLDVLSDNIDKTGEKDSKKRPRPNTAVAVRAKTPASVAQPTPVSSIHVSNKRSKMETGAPYPPSIRSSTATPTPTGAYYASSGRAILGSRNTMLNMTTPSYAIGQKTPTSSLPRPKMSYAPSVPLMPVSVYANQYANLGLGVPTGMKSRAVSASSLESSRSAHSGAHKRRESFRPRASVDERSWLGDANGRYAGLGESVQEEDES